MNPHLAEQPAPPAVDISSEAVRQNVEFLRTGFHINHEFFTDALQAIAADRDAIAAERDRLVHELDRYRTFVRSARAIVAPFAPINDLPYPDDKPVVLKFYDRKNCETLVPFGVWGDFRRAQAWLAAESAEIGTARDGGDPKVEGKRT